MELSLQTQEKKAFEQLTVSEQKFVGARFSKRQPKEDPETYNFIKIVIQNALIGIGVKDMDNQKTLDYLTNQMFKDLNKRYKISLDDFALIIDNGVHKIYGDFFGFNITTISGWIKIYTESKERQLAIKKYHDLIEQQNNKPELSEEEKERICNEGAIKSYSEWLETGELPMFPYVIFDTLNSKMIFSGITDKTVNECKLMAKQQVELLKIKARKNAVSFSDAFKDIKNKYENLFKKFILLKYFESLKSKGVKELKLK